eukprot:GHVU01093588.1.p1 GENE.GHVU01093588.1~~GHVU01093588.1.p1  ORF type:complete len:173 (-),score=17.47 GHVU01093588.1:376-894(-)
MAAVRLPKHDLRQAPSLGKLPEETGIVLPTFVYAPDRPLLTAYMAFAPAQGAPMEIFNFMPFLQHFFGGYGSLTEVGVRRQDAKFEAYELATERLFEDVYQRVYTPRDVDDILRKHGLILTPEQRRDLVELAIVQSILLTTNDESHFLRILDKVAEATANASKETTGTEAAR